MVASSMAIATEKCAKASPGRFPPTSTRNSATAITKSTGATHARGCA